MLTAILTGKCTSILDVGAGDAKWGKLIRSWVPRMRANVQKIVAIEICPASVKKYHLRDIYDEVIIGDMRTYADWSEFDVVILGDVLEHVRRAEGIAVISRLRRTVARVYLTIPITDCPQDGTPYGNQHETHLDQWTHEELQAEGWEQLHQGLNPNGRVTIGTYVLRRMAFK